MPNFIDTKEPLDLANRTYFFHDNIIVLEIDNLLSGWPTYILDFTPERPGPLKLILRLKDASEFRVVEDEAERSPQQAKNSNIPPHISAKPVVLHVVQKDMPTIVRMREKFEDEHSYTWPPRHGFREISARTRITQTEALMALPAAVAALNLEA
ncbi:hypothetical protein DFH29DRAFT_1009026 [Suillus ampliporus]|nr:hypothetical protein DFH29DRAFT_1009026 [Suillus ampliporus]